MPSRPERPRIAWRKRRPTTPVSRIRFIPPHRLGHTREPGQPLGSRQRVAVPVVVEEPRQPDSRVFLNRGRLGRRTLARDGHPLPGVGHCHEAPVAALLIPGVEPEFVLVQSRPVAGAVRLGVWGVLRERGRDRPGNRQIEDYNSRCGSYQYRPGELERARREVGSVQLDRSGGFPSSR